MKREDAPPGCHMPVLGSIITDLNPSPGGGGSSTSTTTTSTTTSATTCATTTRGEEREFHHSTAQIQSNAIKDPHTHTNRNTTAQSQ